ncbi:long-chain-fatty-acid-CoA ligase 5-like protein [Sarcoptes scabiei]|uniref:long-chain-fatty-acid--CoA ligase n=1 Tax=Sarcoptes scabiei TaxID=52283 RepID=A0A131ZZM8_SARSC|nr:long-chain-fatty-acid-CoA ligase 5-like protein [Sarcoptes scabiei]
MAWNILLTIVIVFFTLYFYFTRKKSSKTIAKFQQVCQKYDYDNQCIEKKANDEIIRSSKFTSIDPQDPNKLKFTINYYENCRTMYDVLPQGSELTIDRKCLGRLNESKTEIDWISFDEVIRRNKYFGDGLIHIGVEPKSTFGIYSVNSPEYTITEHGCYRHSIIVIPIYETLGSNICAFIAKQAALSTIFCDDLKRVSDVLDCAFEFGGSLKHIIVSFVDDDNQFSTLKSKAELTGLKLFTMHELETLGEINPVNDHKPHPDDLAVICYTSGTTDAPKGVMLSHENIVANFSTIMYHLDEYHLTSKDTLISYLPLGHMFERVCEAGMLAAGGKIGYFSGDIKRLSDDMKIIKPTMFPCMEKLISYCRVPRVLNKIYSKVQENVSSSSIKSWLLNQAYKAKKSQLSNRIYDNDTFWDILVFNKIRKLLGGHVRLIPVGSAPMNGKIIDFLRCALGCHILEGYGQTECVSAATVNTIGDFSLNNVGVPLNACCLKLIDVPDMNYWVSKGKGEVLIKGSIVFKGYYKDPKKTSETIDKDGWLHTGDIGTFNMNGTLRIIDRKKDIFKLAQGEYIAPSKIEDVHIQSPYIMQIFVYGDSFKSCLIAIVVPNFAMVQEALKNRGKLIDINNNDELRVDQDIRDFILEELNKSSAAAKMKSFEKVRDVHIHPEGFSIENGLVTPTMKNRRFALKDYFKKEIADLYSKLE